MGAKNPDSFSFSEYARGVDTVADILARRRWAIRARCTRCHTLFKVDLRLIVKLAGPRTSLWDRQTPCKVWHCDGKVVFQAKPHPQLKTWTDMITAHRVGFLGLRPERMEDGRPLPPPD